MKKTVDIHGYSKTMERILLRLEGSDISQQNKTLIKQYRDDCSLAGIGIARLVRCIDILRQMAQILEVDYDKASKEDIKRLVRILHERDYTAWTKATYKIILKRFYKWLHDDGDEYPDVVKWIKTTVKRTEKRSPTSADLLNEDEAAKIIHAAIHPRDKAFAAVLFETGVRIGEIGSLQIKDVKRDHIGYILEVTGKTGSRPVRIFRSTPHLVIWLECHPARDNPQAPLWPSNADADGMKLLTYNALSQLLKKICKKAGINKRCNPHIFRHSTASRLSDYMTDAQLCQYMGWIKGSKMVGVYVHTNGKNLDPVLMKANGIEGKHVVPTIRKMQKCHRCQSVSAPESQFCGKCGAPLSLQRIYEMDANTNKKKEEYAHASQTISLIRNDPVIAQRIEQLGIADKLNMAEQGDSQGY